MKFLEHRISDRKMLRLIQKWLKAGVSEDGQWSPSTVGTPQGGVCRTEVHSARSGDFTAISKCVLALCA